MEAINVFDETIGPGFATNHSLVIKFSNTNVIWAVLDSAINTIVAAGNRYLDGTVNISEDLKQSELLRKIGSSSQGSIGKIIVLVDHPVFSLVPDELFRKEDEKKYLSFTHTFQMNERTASDHLQVLNSYNVYWQPSDIIDFAAQHFLFCDFRHFSTVFLRTCHLKNQHPDTIYLYVGDSLLYIIAVKENKFILCNAYGYHTKEDMIYYVMNAARKLWPDLRSVNMMISGEYKDNNEIKTMFSGYIKNVELLKRPSEFKYCKGIDELPPYINSMLFYSFLCA